MPMPETRPGERWEHGSEFHWEDPERDAGENGFAPWAGDARLYGCGRDALRALLRLGREREGWLRLRVPDYFCQEVVAAMAREGLPVAAYPDSPLQAQPDWGASALAPGDVVLWVNYFGLRTGADRAALPDGVTLIEDHTHDPCGLAAERSTADWCVASLRKSLPLPDGGVLWSPAGSALPPLLPPDSPAHEEAALRKWAAMQIKRLYLHGYPVSKAGFRSLHTGGESLIGEGNIAPMTPWSAELLSLLPVHRLREARAANVAALAEALSGCGWVRVLSPHTGEAVPFSAILVLDTAERCSHLRHRLIGQRVYPAVLWSLEEPQVAEIGAAAVDLSRRLLSLHADARYTPHEMRRVAEVVRACGDAGMRPGAALRQ